MTTNRQPQPSGLSAKEVYELLVESIARGVDYKLEIRHAGTREDEFYVFVIHKNVAKSKSI